MKAAPLFRALNSADMARMATSAKQTICYVAPGIRIEVADAIALAAAQIGPEMITVSLDFDERVLRMGYGDIKAVERLRTAGIAVQAAAGIRTSLFITDDEGFVFTPTALYLEPEPVSETAPNAIRMSADQVSEALARLSPSAKAIAVAQARSPEEKARIQALPLDVGSNPVTDKQYSSVAKSIEQIPPVQFDLARQVRVFEPYLQYIELNLSGAAIQRHRLAIPPNILRLGGSTDLEHRLRTTFELIEQGSTLSSEALENSLREIRKNFTPSLGKAHGRVVLKAAKPHLLKRLEEFRTSLEKHQETVKAELQKHLTKSRDEIVNYYLPRVMETPPDALLGQLLFEKPSEVEARQWLNAELDKVFPKADALIGKMRLDEQYKDVTFETLNQEDFLISVKKAFPNIDWDKAYTEFKAAGQSSIPGRAN